MTRPTVTRKYGTYMLDILDRLKADPTRPVVFRYPKQSSAKNAQLDFLCFRNAAVNEGMDRGRTTHVPGRFEGDAPTPVFHPAEYPDLNAYRTRVRKDEAGEGYVLSIYHIDFSDEAKDARRQLGVPEPEVFVEPQEEPSAYANRPKKDD